jgi:hypothetical protein
MTTRGARWMRRSSGCRSPLGVRPGCRGWHRIGPAGSALLAAPDDDVLAQRYELFGAQLSATGLVW